MYLDATADHDPIDYLRADDQGANVLRVDSHGGTIQHIPYAPPEQNALRREYVVDLRDDGGGGVHLADDSNGQYGVMLRYRYGGEQGDVRESLARALAAGFGKVTVDDVSTSDLDDIGQPAHLEATFEAASVWSTQGSLRSLPVGFDPIEIAGVAQEAPDDRVHDLVLDRPYAHQTSVLYHLPEGAQVAELPEPVAIRAPGLLDYSLSAEEVKDGVRVTRRFELLERRIARDRYGAFRDALQQIERAEQRTVLVRPADEPAP
jgi:hypothetical protein